MGVAGWLSGCGIIVLGRVLFSLNCKFVTVCGQNSSDSAPMGETVKCGVIVPGMGLNDKLVTVPVWSVVLGMELLGLNDKFTSVSVRSNHVWGDSAFWVWRYWA